MKHNGKGIHKTFLEDLIYITNGIEYIDIPRPITNAELALVSKFIFGKPLSIRKIKLNTESNISRNKTILNLIPSDYVKTFKLGEVSFLINEEIESYIDRDFSKKMNYNNPFVLEHIFWRSIFGCDMYNTNISTNWTSTFNIYYIDKFIYIRLFIDNINSKSDIVRSEFLHKIKRLYEINNNLDVCEMF